MEMRGLVWLGLLPAVMSCGWCDVGVGQQGQPADPILIARPVAAPGAAREGRISLDVVVTGPRGKSAGGLRAQDFEMYEDGRARPIVSFAAFGEGAGDGAEPPVQVVLVFDAVNSGFSELSFAREALKKFFSNSGTLAQPILMLQLADAGLVSRVGPTTDGKALAAAVEGLPLTMRSINAAQGADGALERLQRSIRTLAMIANNEVRRPGRKLLIWTGPGWPTLRGEGGLYSARGHALNYETILSLSRGLREARMEVCAAGGGSPFFVSSYMRAVRSEKEANSGNLALPVLAVASGGQSLDGGNQSRPDEQLRACLVDAGPYYRISFDPAAVPSAWAAPVAPSVDSAGAAGTAPVAPPGRATLPGGERFHELAVRVNRPGMTARTSTGYYDGP